MKKKVFISILTILISIPLFMDTPLANTTNIQTTNHGTITYDVSGDSNSSDQMGITLGPLTFNVAGKKVSTFTYELDNVYTGTITMQGMGPYFSGGHGTQYNCELYMTNCTVADRNDDKITFYIKEQSSFSVSLVRDNDGTMQYNDWYQIYSETLTASGSELNTLNAIYVYVHSLSDDVLDIKQSVINNLPDIYAALGYDVDNTSSTMRADLQSLKTIMNNIGTQIGTFSGTTLAGTMTSMQSYLISVDQKLNDVKNNTTSIINAINTLHLDLNSLLSVLNNINSAVNSLDEIQYNDVTNTFVGGNSTNSNYSLSNVSSKEMYARFNINNSYFATSSIFVFDIPYALYRVDRLSDVQLYNTSNTNVGKVIYIEQGREDVKVYCLITGWSSSNVVFKLSTLYNDTIWYYNAGHESVKNIKSNNVEYWDLLNITTANTYYFKYSNQLQGIIDAINNMSMNVNQLTVNATGITYNVNNTQVNNSVNTYNTDIQNVYNVENDFSTSFNTYNQQFTPDFTETMSTIQSVPGVMNDIVVDLYGLPFIKYPLLLTLAGIVLIALLGV